MSRSERILYGTGELAMRIVLFVQSRGRPARSLLEYRELVASEFGVSRATAYRYVRLATDLLGLSVETAQGARPAKSTSEAACSSAT